MKTKIIYIFSAVILLVSASVNAENIVIDFEELSSLGSSWGSLDTQEYITQGYKLITDADSFKYATFYGSNHIALSVGENVGLVQFENINNHLFDVQKISFLSDTILNVSLIGVKSDLTNIQYDIYTTGSWQIDEYILSDFDDLLSLSWGCDPELYFDNIVVIPEPVTMLFLIFGGVIIRRAKL